MRPIRNWLVLALSLSVWAHVARAADEPVAVLDVFSEAESLPEAKVGAITDTLRSQTKKALGRGYKVLTQETISEILPAEQLKCLAGQCLAVIGRKLQVKYVVGATLRQVGKTYILTVEAYESASAELLGSEQPRANDVVKLLDFVERDYPALVTDWIKAKTKARGVNEAVIAPRKPFEAPAETQGIVAFTSPVPGTGVLLDGKPLCTAPCRRLATSGRHAWEARVEGYAPMSGTLDLIAGQLSTVMPAAKAQFGLLHISSSPSGQDVEFDGHPIGQTPLDYRIFDENTHKLRVSGSCVVPIERAVTVAIGSESAQSIELKPAMKHVSVKLNDVLPASTVEVFVDGLRAGTAAEVLDIPICTNEVSFRPANPDYASHSLPLKRDQSEVVAELDTTCRVKRNDHVTQYRATKHSSGVEFSTLSGLSFGATGRGATGGVFGTLSIGGQLYSGPRSEARLSAEIEPHLLWGQNNHIRLGGSISIRHWDQGDYKEISLAGGIAREIPYIEKLDPYIKASLNFGQLFARDTLSTTSVSISALSTMSGNSYIFSISTGFGSIGPDSIGMSILTGIGPTASTIVFATDTPLPAYILGGISFGMIPLYSHLIRNNDTPLIEKVKCKDTLSTDKEPTEIPKTGATE